MKVVSLTPKLDQTGRQPTVCVDVCTSAYGGMRELPKCLLVHACGASDADGLSMSRRRRRRLLLLLLDLPRYSTIHPRSRSSNSRKYFSGEANSWHARPSTKAEVRHELDSGRGVGGPSARRSYLPCSLLLSGWAGSFVRQRRRQVDL